MSNPSYTCGPQDKPLLAMTIGEAFDQTVARFLIEKHWSRVNKMCG